MTPKDRLIEMIVKIQVKTFREMGMGEILSNPSWNSVGYLYKVAHALLKILPELVEVDVNKAKKAIKEATRLIPAVVENLMTSDVVAIAHAVAHCKGVIKVKND